MFLGATVGRVANRIKNARFKLNGKEYKLAANNGTSCLHGGVVGFDKKLWKAETDSDSVIFTLTSPDGGRRLSRRALRRRRLFPLG